MNTKTKNYTPPLRLKAGNLTIGARNAVMRNIYHLMKDHQSFLILGHKLPDEDCYASLVSCGLILRKFNKNVTVFLEADPPEHLTFLTSICKYNNIDVYYGSLPQIERPTVVCILDTPKPEMIAADGCAYDFLADDGIIKVELDHHFSSDAAYAASKDYSLVIHASSTCEILCLICYKISRNPAVLHGYNIDELFSRNLVLTLLTGMLGDAKMGNYLAKRRDRQVFKYFSGFLNRTLKLKTRYRTNTKRINSIDVLLGILESSTEQHENIYSVLIEHILCTGKIGTVLLTKEESDELLKSVPYHSFVGMIKLATNAAAEKAQGVGISVYYDTVSDARCIHCRIRASEAVRGINLHPVLSHFGISDGGGHPGAIAFRLPQEKYPDIASFISIVQNFITETILV